MMKALRFLMWFFLVLIGNCRAKLIIEQNPNCISECPDCDVKSCPKENEPWLSYGTNEIGNATYHFLWSAMQLPVFLIASSKFGSEMKINWNDFQIGRPNSITFSPIPDNIFGVSFQGLILFDDKNDTGKLDGIPEDSQIYIGLDEFNWEFSGFHNDSSEEITASFTSVEFKNKTYNGSKITINITAFGKEDRGSELPHLLAKANSAQVDVILDDISFDPSKSMNSKQKRFGKKHHHKGHVPIGNFSHARWALDMIVISDEKQQTSEMIFQYVSTTSLSDENSPGVFTLNEIVSKLASKKNSSDGGYIQWRPVCYLTDDSDVNFSTVPNFNTSLPPIDEEHHKRARKSLLYALFGDVGIKHLSGFQSSVAFGLTKDEFYTSFNYTKWTFSFGTGTPPVEGFSLLVILSICIGVGVPLTVFMIGGFYMLIRKFMGPRTVEEEEAEVLINEEEEEE